MRRLHLFEFEDQRWFPHRLRAAMTAYLAATYRITPFPRLWAGQIACVLEEGRLNEIVDLGSGSGGPVPLVAAELDRLGRKVHITLTDLYPGAAPSGADDSIRYWPTPVNAANVPPELAGVRTMFASFHHFPPKQARSILRDAFEQRRTICLFEGTARAPAVIASALVIPLLVLLLTPRIRPLSLFQIVFTYLAPVLPLLIFWDGLVSQLRTYTEQELRGFTSTLQSPQYCWTIGSLRIPGLPAATPYLVGRPTN